MEFTSIKDMVKEQQNISEEFDFIEEFQKSVTTYQKRIDKRVDQFLHAQKNYQQEIKKNIKQHIEVRKRRAGEEMKKSIDDPARIGNELLAELEKGIEQIHNLMNETIITVYKIAKRIAYDFDLLK